MAEGGREGNMQVGDGGISNTVEVRGFLKKTSQELIEMYFENSRRSGGGDVEEVRISDEVAYITFKEAEVAQKVASRSNHQVDGHTLTVTLFHPLPPKPCYQNRVLIQGVNNAITEELLRNFLETETKAEVTEFLYGEEDGNVVVTLSDNIDIVQLGKIFQESSIQGVFLKAARVAISNCILVQNLHPSTSHDVILYYFENKRRSGGGDVERVEMKTEERYCLIYFEDPSVIDRVLGRQSHNVDGVDFEIHLHHECLGRRSSRKKSDLYLRMSSPGNKDNATLEDENTDNQANDKTSSSVSSNPVKESDFVEDKTSSSVSSNPEKESDFVEVQEWQANDGNNCTLSLCIKYKRAPDKKIIKCMKNIPCSWNFHLYWSFYTKTEPGKQMLHEIINNYNCSVTVFAEDEDFFLFEITENIFEQESDVVQLIHVVLDSVHKCAQQFLYLDNILVVQRIQGDVLQEVRQRKELDIARFELMGQQDFDVLCVICTEKDETLVHHAVTEIIHMVKECFENHEEIIDVDHKWQKVMKTFGYLQKLCEKYPNVTITDKTEAAIILKGPRDQSKPAADHFLELLGTASSEVQEEIFSPGCQFEIFTYPEMCGYIDNIAREHSIVWIPNQKTKKIHLFSKMSEKKKGVDKFIRGCVQERLYPLAKDQTVFSTKMFRSLEELKNMHTGKMVFSSSHKGLLLTATDDIFESIDDAVQEIICKETENECGIARRDVKKKVSTAEESREEKYLETMTERGETERNKEQLSQEDTEKEVQSHETDKENVKKLVPTKNSDTLDSPIVMPVQKDMCDEKSRKEKEVEFPNSKAEGDAARPLEHNACFGCQVSKATKLFGNEQQSVGNEDEKKKVTASDSDTMNGTNTEGKRQRHRKTENADKVTKAVASGSQGNLDTDADSKSPEDDVSEESASENDDDNDGDLMKFTVVIRNGKKTEVICAPEGENALKWRFLFDCPHTHKELNEDPVMVGIQFECIKGYSPVLEVKKRIRSLKNVQTVLQTHAEQIQIYHTIIPAAAVNKFFDCLKCGELFEAEMIIAYIQKTDLYICGKKEHMEEAIQTLKHAKDYVLKLISRTEKIPMKDAPLQLVKRLMEVHMRVDIQYEFREYQNCLHITGLESEIIKEREKLNNLLGCITQSKYIPKKCEQFSIFEELEVVKYIEGILQEQKLVCTLKTCKEDCSIVVTAFDEETCEKACKVIDAACVTETVPLQIDATTIICLGDSWEQELSSVYTKYGGKMKIWLNKAQDNLEYVCTLNISEMAEHEVQSLISTWDRKKHMPVEKEVIEPFIEDEHKLRKLEKKCKVDIRISKIDKVGFLIIGKDSNIQLALEELAKECSMILKPKSKPAASYPSSEDCEIICVPGSNEVELIILKDRCHCHCDKSSQVKLKNTDTEIVEIIPLFPINASQPDEVKANVVLPADKSQRPVTFFCPKWKGGASKEKETLDSALCHLFNFLSSLGGVALLEIKDERIGNWYVGKFVKWLLVTFQKHLRTKPENTTMSRLLLLIKDKKVYDIVKATVADVYEVEAWATSGNLLHSEDKRERPTEEEPTGIFNTSKTSSNIKELQISRVHEDSEGGNRTKTIIAERGQFPKQSNENEDRADTTMANFLSNIFKESRSFPASVLPQEKDASGHTKIPSIPTAETDTDGLMSSEREIKDGDGMFYYPNEKTTIKLVSVNICDIDTDALVSIEDANGSGNGPIAKALLAAAGSRYQDFEHFKVKMAKRSITEVVVTGSGRLKCDFVLHAIAPEWGIETTRKNQSFQKNVEKTMMNIMDAAFEKKVKCIAVPLIGIFNGMSEVPLTICCEAMIAGLDMWIQSHSQEYQFKEVILICSNPVASKCFANLLSANRKEDIKGGRSTRGISLTSSEMQSKSDASITSSSNIQSKENCVICMESITDPKVLPKCGHTFCKECIDQQFMYKPACPCCGVVYGKITGSQPNGTMQVFNEKYCLPGFEGCSTIVIFYEFSGGIQKAEHPHPGRPYNGTKRKAYLPNNKRGKLVLRLLQEAFKRRLVFTIGTSRTTGQEDSVIWNDIHHKTNRDGGPQKFGYPDPIYLDRVMEELAVKGITEESL